MDEHICKAKLDDGRIVECDMVYDKSGLTEFMGWKLKEIGRGRIYSINKTIQTILPNDPKQFFYVKTFRSQS